MDDKMLTKLPAIIFYPILGLWSLVYGALAGAVFKILAAYENWVAINRLQILLWKKYPQRSYKKYIANIWASQVRGLPVEFTEYARSKIQQSHPEEPFPLLRIMTNTLFMLVLTPFMALCGMIDGPAYVFRQAIAQRKKLQLIS